MKYLSQHILLGITLFASISHGRDITEDTTWSSGVELNSGETLHISAGKTLTIGGILNAKAGKIEMGTGASIQVNNTDIYTGTKSIRSTGTITALNDLATIEGEQLSHLSLTGLNIYFDLTKNLTLQDVILNNISWSSSYYGGAGNIVFADNLTYAVSTGAGLTSIDVVGDEMVFNLNDISGQQWLSLSGDLTLNLTLTQAEQDALDAHLASGGTARVDLKNLKDEMTVGAGEADLNSMTIALGSYSQYYGHADLSLSSNMIGAQVVPEPSTATLSLLALAAFMSRRRRRV